MPSLSIAVPTHSRTISVQTAVTLLDLQTALRGRWEVQVRFHSASVISDLRNLIAAHFLASDHDVGFMLDADQGIPVPAVLRMLESGHPVIGAFYPRRNFFWDNVRREGGSLDIDKARIQATRFVGNPLSDATGNVQVVNGMVRATGVGGGALMIRREVFARLSGAHPELAGAGFPNEDENLPLPEHNWGFFNPIIDPARGLHLGEDLSFCRRWTKGCGGEIWAEVVTPTEHVGQTVFKGAWLDYIQSFEGG